jgi:transcriptional regulator with XRE-family HTH domain
MLWKPKGRFTTGIGAALVYLRQKAGLSQSKLGIKANWEPSRFRKFEMGRYSPSADVIEIYLEHCDADEFDLADAFLGEDPDEDELLRRALRALRVGNLPPDLEETALEQLRTQRQLLLRLSTPDRTRLVRNFL